MYLVKCNPYKLVLGISLCAFYHAAGVDYVFDQLSAPGVLMLEYGVSVIPSNLV